jgi:hypothetical protein
MSTLGLSLFTHHRPDSASVYTHDARPSTGESVEYLDRCLGTKLLMPRRSALRMPPGYGGARRFEPRARVRGTAA